jgi:hypothetical protein
MDKHNISVLLMPNYLNIERKKEKEGAKDANTAIYVQLKSITCSLCGSKRRIQLQWETTDDKKVFLSNLQS